MNELEILGIKESENIINSEDCKILCIELNPNGNLTLKYANETFLTVFDFHPDVIGKKIFDIFDKSLSKIITEKFYFYYQKQDSFTFINLLENSIHTDEKGSWKYHVYFKNNVMICIGTKIYPSEDTYNLECKSSDIHQLNYTNYLYFSVLKKEKSYYFSSDDTTLLNIINHDTLIGEKLNVIDLFSYEPKIFNIFDSCIYNHKIIEYVDCNEHNYYKVRLIPSKTNKWEIYVLVIYISKEEYENEKFSQYATYTFFPVESNYASCMIKIENGKKSFELANKYFNELQDEYHLKVEKIMRTREFQLTVKEGIYTKATYSLKNNHGIECPVLINFIPINTQKKESKKILLVATISEKQLKDNQLENILTKRELEIATSVAQNETNKYIAHKLNICEGTVKRTVYNIYQKLGINSRVELTKLLYHCTNE